MKTVLLKDALTYDQRVSLEAKLATAGDYCVEVGSDEADWAQRAENATVLLIRDEDVSAALINSTQALSLIIKLVPGKGCVDDKAACSRDVEVDVIENMGILAVAEHAVLLMLALAKKLPEVHRLTQANVYADTFTPSPTTQKQYAFNWSGIQGMDVLYRRTLGLIGFGTIGRSVAARAKAFAMDVVYYDVVRLPADEEARLGVRFASLDDLLHEADYVSLHTRVTDATKKMVNAEFLSKMKPSACVINTARGLLVDEDALVAALHNGTIGGAGLDVFLMEPPQNGNPLLTCENVIATSHCAGIFNDDAQVMEVGFIAKKLGA